MATLTESVLIAAPLAPVWEHYFEPRGWPGWVDGFRAVESSSGYPERGGTLTWRSTPAGRGTVRERVIEHQPRRRHEIEFSDPESSGTLLTTLEVEGEATRVELELRYSLASRGPLAGLTERLFVRSQVRRSLQRSLLRLKHEVEEIAALTDASRPSDR